MQAMTRLARPLQTRYKTRALLWLLLLGMVWLQLLGAVHRQVHPSADGYGARNASAESTWLPVHATKSLADKQDPSEGVACQLLDSACSGLALLVAMPAAASPQHLADSIRTTFFYLATAGFFVFQARGPPALI
jgi:hypothetical protein